MLFRLLLLTGFLIGAVVAPRELRAQQVSVQQPQFEQFSVATTVSVPDGGSALLGGVGRAASGQVITGPFRSNKKKVRKMKSLMMF